MAETLETIKKYIGPFSGSQMDQIFYEILNYTSERYAKGTQNGQAVAAGTIGYQDNSYYYSRQALQSAQAAANAADRAEAAVPAGIDSAVLFTRAQTLTVTQQAQARKNIMAGGSNPNLLDNPWFTVNQRNVTSGGSYVDSTYVGPDRWKVFRTTAWSVANNAITITWDGSGSGVSASGGFLQYLGPDHAYLGGRQVTVSAYVDGTLYSRTVTFPQSQGSLSAVNLGGDVRFTLNNSTARGPEIQFRNMVQEPRTIGPVKLELGSYSTLANDTPPNYAEELAKCQRYAILMEYISYSVIGYGQALSATAARYNLAIPTALNNIYNNRLVTVLSGTPVVRKLNNISNIAIQQLGLLSSNGIACVNVQIESGYSSGETFELYTNTSPVKLLLSNEP